MIVLVTDYGPCGPYLGQLCSVLSREAPGVPIVNLVSDAPRQNPRASAYFLAAYTRDFPADSVFLVVVDPGVGSGEQEPLVVRAGDQWFVGPGNGLFNIVMQRASDAHAWIITWRPPSLSATFHGRDLYAPVAARLARGEAPPGRPMAQRGDCPWPDDLTEVIYIDHFGNAMTGIRTATVPPESLIVVNGRSLRMARTFSGVPAGQAFWYENANGLCEIAVNRGRADKSLGLQIGTPIEVRRP
jgi:S-adenosylmethionine hydrolase